MTETISTLDLDAFQNLILSSPEEPAVDPDRDRQESWHSKVQSGPADELAAIVSQTQKDNEKHFPHEAASALTSIRDAGQAFLVGTGEKYANFKRGTATAGYGYMALTQETIFDFLEIIEAGTGYEIALDKKKDLMAGFLKQYEKSKLLGVAGERNWHNILAYNVGLMFPEIAVSLGTGLGGAKLGVKGAKWLYDGARFAEFAGVAIGTGLGNFTGEQLSAIAAEAGAAWHEGRDTNYGAAAQQALAMQVTLSGLMGLGRALKLNKWQLAMLGSGVMGGMTKYHGGSNDDAIAASIMGGFMGLGYGNNKDINVIQSGLQQYKQWALLRQAQNPPLPANWLAFAQDHLPDAHKKMAKKDLFFDIQNALDGNDISPYDRLVLMLEQNFAGADKLPKDLHTLQPHQMVSVLLNSNVFPKEAASVLVQSKDIPIPGQEGNTIIGTPTATNKDAGHVFKFFVDGLVAQHKEFIKLRPDYEPYVKVEQHHLFQDAPSPVRRLELLEPLVTSGQSTMFYSDKNNNVAQYTNSKGKVQKLKVHQLGLDELMILFDPASLPNNPVAQKVLADLGVFTPDGEPVGRVHIENLHRSAVKESLEKGVKVPKHVLKSYPDLAEKYAHKYVPKNYIKKRTVSKRPPLDSYSSYQLAVADYKAGERLLLEKQKEMDPKARQDEGELLAPTEEVVGEVKYVPKLESQGLTRWKKLKDTLWKAFMDSEGSLVETLHKHGLNKAALEWNNKTSIIPKTERAYVDLDANMGWEGWSKEQRMDFDLYYDAVAQLAAIQRKRGRDNTPFTGSQTADNLRERIKYIREKADENYDGGFARMQEQGRIIQQTYQNLVDEMLDTGLITPEAELKIRDQAYSPQKLVEEMIKSESVSLGGGKRAEITNNLLQYLKTGIEQGRFMDQEWLLKQHMGLVYRYAQKNRILGAMHAAVMEDPENKIARSFEGADWTRPEPSRSPGDHMLEVSFFNKGKKQKMWVDKYILSLMDTEPFMASPDRSTIRSLLGWLSGTTPVKLGTTTLSGIFGLTMIPVDYLHIMFNNPTLRQGAGIPFLNKTFKRYFMGAKKDKDRFHSGLMGNIREILNDGPKLREAEKNGLAVLSMWNMDQQNLLLRTNDWQDRSRVNTARHGVAGTINRKLMWMQKWGHSMEMGARLTEYEMLIEQGKPPREAAALVNRRLDYSKSGFVTDILDTVIPYLRPGLRASDTVIKTLKDPKTWSDGSLVKWAGGYWMGQVGLRMWNETMCGPMVDASRPMEDRLMTSMVCIPQHGFIDPVTKTKQYAYMKIKDGYVPPFMLIKLANIAIMDHVLSEGKVSMSKKEFYRYGDMMIAMAKGFGMAIPEATIPVAAAWDAVVNNRNRYGGKAWHGPPVLEKDEIYTKIDQQIDGRGRVTSEPAKMWAGSICKLITGAGAKSAARWDEAGQSIIVKNEYTDMLKLVSIMPRDEQSIFFKNFTQEMPGFNRFFFMTPANYTQHKNFEHVQKVAGSEHRKLIVKMEDPLFKVLNLGEDYTSETKDINKAVSMGLRDIDFDSKEQKLAATTLFKRAVETSKKYKDMTRQYKNTYKMSELEFYEVFGGTFNYRQFFTLSLKDKDTMVQAAADYYRDSILPHELPGGHLAKYKVSPMKAQQTFMKFLLLRGIKENAAGEVHKKISAARRVQNQEERERTGPLSNKMWIQQAVPAN